MLSRDLEAYRKYTLALNFDSSFQFVPPKMFEIIPYDTLKATMIQAMDNEYMSIKMTGLDFGTKKKIKIKKTGQYHLAFVPYKGSMQLTLKGKKEFRTILVSAIKSEFGSENVLMENDSTMQVELKNKEFTAFKDAASPRWWLIEDKRSEKGSEAEQQKILFETIMPKEILTAIAKRKN